MGSKDRGTVVYFNNYKTDAYPPTPPISLFGEEVVVHTLSSLKERLIIVSAQEELEALIKRTTVKTIAKRRAITSSTYLCAGYTAGVIASAVKTPPEHWIAFRFLEEGIERNNPYVLQRGADICLLICSVFPGRATWRLMSRKYYESMGVGLYFSFARQTRSYICELMSKHFSLMARAVRDGIATL